MALVGRWVRLGFRMVALAYLGGLLLLWLAFHWVGEAWPLLAVLLYLPPQSFLLPFALLLPLALLLDRRMGLLLCAAVVVSGWTFLGIAWSPNRRPGPESVGLLTYNRGQNANQSMRPFVEAQNPDLILLQDAKKRGTGYRSSYPEYPHLSELDEFILLSRFPIRSTERIEFSAWNGAQSLPAVRCVTEIRGVSVAVYNVHIPTPRDALRSAGLRTLLLSLLPIAGGRHGEAVAALRHYWNDRLRMIVELRKRIDAETIPTLVAGDFNTPGLGRGHRLLIDGVADAHLAAGRGTGYTFPGTSGNPLTLFGPWLRLDRVLAGPGIRIESALAEPSRASQHRAFAARVSLPRPKPAP